MKLFGYELTRTKAAPPVSVGAVTSQSSWLGWLGTIRESFTGAWQRNITVDSDVSILAFSAVFCCVTGIASDVAKLRVKLTENVNGIWKEITSNSPFLGVLKKPNRYQTRIKFIEQWIVSKLLYGNAYVLKERDKRGIVVAMYVLDPRRVTPLVTEDGGVYYELHQDFLSQVSERVVVPASEIIHDMMVCLWHPLVGVTPLYACGVSATMGNRIQRNSTGFFANSSTPGGILSAPGAISKETALRLKTEFETNFSGDNMGRIAVLGDNLKFEMTSMPAVDAQLIEQLRWTVEDVARAYHYPLFKLGGPLPPYSSNLEALNMGYYTDCLQTLIEAMELCLDEGLGLPDHYGTEVDLDNLMRMDTMALYDSNTKAVTGGWMMPDEARFRANYSPTPGGDSPYLQQQNYSLAALAKRDALADPFGVAPPPAKPAPPPDPTPEATAKVLDVYDLEFADLELRKELSLR